ncbi:MAG: hypothetical protein FJX78_01890 [Armatimonadetes bacterium]|nr:hypothetical protein [Armatimonadota bacterium]
MLRSIGTSRLRRVLPVLIVALMLGSASAVNGAPAAPATGTPVRGGSAKIAMKTEPDTLDIMWSTSDIIYWIAVHIFEGLMSYDAEWKPVPHLASAHNVSGDGLTHTFTLRRGVRFHNGKEMTSEDVVASLKRWSAISPIGRDINERTNDIVARDRYTVDWRLKAPVSILPYALALWSQAPMIYPSEVVAAAAPRRQITEFIGTGPYRFAEWRRGQQVRMTRYNEYQPLSSAPNGRAGRRDAHLDEVIFVFVPEPSVRQVGLEAGDFHFVMEADRESYPRYRFNLKYKSYLGKAGTTWLVPNHGSPLFNRPRLRTAFQTSVCADAILAIYANPRFYRKDPSVMGPGKWNTDVGREFYNQCNTDRARQQLREGGYDGRPMRMLLASTDQPKIDIATVLQQQLGRVNMPMEHLLRDASGYARVRADRQAWDMLITESSFREHPVLVSHLPANGIPGWQNPDKEKLVDDLMAATNPQQETQIWRRIEQLWHQDVAAVKVGDFFAYNVARVEFEGLGDRPFPYFWNSWLRKR